MISVSSPCHAHTPSPMNLHIHIPKVALGNICCLTNFLGGIDEEHFRLVHVVIEANAVPAVAAMLQYAETRSARFVTANLKMMVVVLWYTMRYIWPSALQ